MHDRWHLEALDIVRVTAYRRKATHAFHANAKRLRGFIRAREAKGRHGHDDDVRLPAAQRLIREPQAVHDFSREVINDHITTLYQAPHHLLPLWTSDIDCHTQLVAGMAIKHGVAVPRTCT